MRIRVTGPHLKDSPSPQARLPKALFPEHLLAQWGIKNLGLGPSDIWGMTTQSSATRVALNLHKGRHNPRASPSSKLRSSKIAEQEKQMGSNRETG